MPSWHRTMDSGRFLSSPKELWLKLHLDKGRWNPKCEQNSCLWVDEEKERSFPKGVDLLLKASFPQTPGLTLREKPAAFGPRWQIAPQLIIQPSP